VFDPNGVNGVSGNSCHSYIAGNLYAAILASDDACTSEGYTTNGTTSAVCYAPEPLVSVNQRLSSTGQTTAAAPTGTSGLTIVNSGSGAQEFNIYFGTLSGTRAQSSAVKLTQSGLH
jgi:hypothetical protein